jgi:hypothetical protein
MDVSAFSVADACDKDSDIFFEQDGAYGLVVWQHARSLRQPLMTLLDSGPLLLTALADQWSKRFASSFNPESVQAALHHCQDSFYPVQPLSWARKDRKETPLYDPTSFTFESLMPTL